MSSVAQQVTEPGVYLRASLAPFAGFLDRADVTDIYINRPEEIWLERLGGHIERHNVPGLDEKMLARLARQIAALTHQGISREHPIMSALLPDGSRVQIVAPPAKVTHAKPFSSDLTREVYQTSPHSTRPNPHWVRHDIACSFKTNFDDAGR